MHKLPTTLHRLFVFFHWFHREVSRSCPTKWQYSHTLTCFNLGQISIIFRSSCLCPHISSCVLWISKTIIWVFFSDCSLHHLTFLPLSFSSGQCDLWPHNFPLAYHCSIPANVVILMCTGDSYQICSLLLKSNSYVGTYKIVAFIFNVEKIIFFSCAWVWYGSSTSI